MLACYLLQGSPAAQHCDTTGDANSPTSFNAQRELCTMINGTHSPCMHACLVKRHNKAVKMPQRMQWSWPPNSAHHHGVDQLTASGSLPTCSTESTHYTHCPESAWYGMR